MPAYAPPLVANYAYLFRRLTKFAGVADPNDPEGNAVAPNAPFTLQMLRSQLVQSDYEVSALVASVESQPYRNTYFTAEAVEVAAGGKINAYIGVHGGVEVQVEQNGAWSDGKLAQSLEHLQRNQDKLAIGPNRIPASSKKLYFIDNGELHYLATNGRITLPTIPIGDDAAETPVLYSPRQLQNSVLAHSLTILRPVGVDSAHRLDWQSIWAAYVQMITDGAYSLPEPERVQRIAS
jgi:hypothetical protein